jgi:hypothetical protein
VPPLITGSLKYENVPIGAGAALPVWAMVVNAPPFPVKMPAVPL